MKRFLHVVRTFVGGPLDGQHIETNVSPAPWCEVVAVDNPDGLIHTYILSDWKMPVATYTWKGGVPPT